MPEAIHALITPVRVRGAAPVLRLAAAHEGQAPRAPDPHAPPPIGAARERQVLGDFAALLLLTPTEAGAIKAAELDGELLACLRAARVLDAEADRLADTALAATPLDIAACRRTLDLLDAFDRVVSRAARLPARTPEGLRAKAALLQLALDSTDDELPRIALAAGLAADIVGGTI